MIAQGLSPWSGSSDFSPAIASRAENIFPKGVFSDSSGFSGFGGSSLFGLSIAGLFGATSVFPVNVSRSGLAFLGL